MFAGVVSDLGIATYLVKALAIDRDPSGARTALRLNTIGSAVLVVIGFTALTLLAFREHWPLSIGALAVWVGLEKNIEAQLSLYISKQLVFVPTVSVAIRRVIPVLLYLILTQIIDLDADTAFATSLCIGGIFGTFHATIASKSPAVRITQPKAPITQVLRRATPFLITNCATQVRNLDVPIVATFSGSFAAGIYSAAMRLSTPIFLVASSIATSIIPGVGKEGITKAVQLVHYMMLIATAMATLVLLMTPIAGPLMSLIYGSAYQPFGFVLVLIIAGTLFNSLLFPLTALIQAAGKTRVAALINALVAVVLIGALAFGSILGGIQGAALGYLASQVVAVSTVYLLFRMSATRPANRKLKSI